MDLTEVVIEDSGRGTIRVSGMGRRRMDRMEEVEAEDGVRAVGALDRGMEAVRRAGSLDSRRRSQRVREGCWASCLGEVRLARVRAGVSEGSEEGMEEGMGADLVRKYYLFG